MSKVKTTGKRVIKTAKKFLIEAQKEKVSNIIYHDITSGCASTGPPLGPMLGQRGIPIAKFVQDFNEKTKHMIQGIPIPTKITLDGRNYQILINSPTIEYLLKQAAGVKREIVSRNGEIIGKLTYKHIYEIAKLKIKDHYYVIRDYTMEKMCEELANHCHTIGLEIVYDYDPAEYAEFIKDVLQNEQDYQAKRAAEIEERKKKLL